MYGKFQSKHKRYKEGFKGSLESKIAKLLRTKKCKAEYESMRVPYVLPKIYKPDFTITNPNGYVWYLEVKGYFRYEDQVKMKAVKFSNPELDIRMYFPKDNRVQRSDMTNSQWCEKYGYKYSVGKLPSKWFT